MRHVTRTDYAPLDLAAPVELPNGWLRAEGRIGRTGVLEYQEPDGSVRREYRSPEEAFNADTLASFASVPLTLSHPPEGVLTAENTREHQVGTVERPTRDGEFMRAAILITDADAIAAARAGKVQLSCGYTADVIDEPGVTPDGQQFDCRQVRVRGNHVALVDVGRAGPAVSLRADAIDAERLDAPTLQYIGAHCDDSPETIRAKFEFRATLDSHFGVQLRPNVTDEQLDEDFRAALAAHFTRGRR